MKRILPDELVAAYAETGLRPTDAAWFLGRTHACGLGCLYAKSVAEWSAEPHLALRWAGDAYGVDYATGFLNGFDGQPYHPALIGSKGSKHRLEAGHNDGRACREAVLGK